MLDPKKGLLCDGCGERKLLLYQREGSDFGACCVPREEGGCFFCGVLPAPHDYFGECICTDCHAHELQAARS